VKLWVALGFIAVDRDVDRAVTDHGMQATTARQTDGWQTAKRQNRAENEIVDGGGELFAWFHKVLFHALDSSEMAENLPRSNATVTMGP